MQYRRFAEVIGAVSLLAMIGTPTSAVNAQTLRAQLSADREVPVCSSTGSGKIKVEISQGETSLDYKLQYDLVGTVLFAHIHLGKPNQAAGIVAFLCGGGGKPDCPASPATVTGTIVASDII